MKVVLSVILMLINVNLAFSSIEGWTEACIGTSDLGAAYMSGHNGDYIIEGGGNLIEGTEDSFYFVYQLLDPSVDFSISARVLSVENAHSEAKGGIMIRSNLNANARNVFVGIKGNNTLQSQYRSISGGSTFGTNMGIGYPRYVKIKKVGDTFTTYYSNGGRSWNAVQSLTLDMNTTIYIGMAVAGRVSNEICTTKYDHVCIHGAQNFDYFEAEDGLLGGGATTINNMNYNHVKESSNYENVKLSANGQFVQWDISRPYNAMVIRFNIPDAPNGGGITRSLSIYKNGRHQQDAILTSKYAWCYSGDSDDPKNKKNHKLWDHVIVKFDGWSLSGGDTLKLQKDAGDTANPYRVDCIMLETAPPEDPKPSNYLCITSYGAVANDNTCDIEAIYKTIEAVNNQGKEGVWIPAGNFDCIDIGASINTLYSGYNGSGYIDHMGSAGSFVKYFITGMDVSGDYTIHIRYANGTRRTSQLVFWCHGDKQFVSFDPTGNWNTWKTKTITSFMKSGTNGIILYNDGSGGDVNLDQIIISKGSYKRTIQLEDRTDGEQARAVFLDNMKIKGAGYWYSVLRGYYARMNMKGDNVGISDFRIEGETLTKNTTNSDNGVLGDPGDNSYVKNMWILHTQKGIRLGDWKENYCFANNLTVENNRVMSIKAGGIITGGYHNNTIIRNNWVQGCGDDIYFIGSGGRFVAGPTSVYTKVENSLLEFNQGSCTDVASGLCVNGIVNSVVQYNYIHSVQTNEGLNISSQWWSTFAEPLSLICDNMCVGCGFLVDVKDSDIAHIYVNNTGLYNPISYGIKVIDRKPENGYVISNSLSINNIRIENAFTGLQEETGCRGDFTITNLWRNNCITNHIDNAPNLKVTVTP